MWRRSFVTFLGSTIVMGSFTAYARQSGRLRRIGVLMSQTFLAAFREELQKLWLDRGPTAFFNSPIGRAIRHRRNQVVRHSTQVGRKHRRPRRKHFRAKLPSKEALVRFRASSILRTTFFDAWGKENKVLRLASAQEKPFCAIYGSRYSWRALIEWNCSIES